MSRASDLPRKSPVSHLRFLQLQLTKTLNFLFDRPTVDAPPENPPEDGGQDFEKGFHEGAAHAEHYFEQKLKDQEERIARLASTYEEEQRRREVGYISFAFLRLLQTTVQHQV